LTEALHRLGRLEPGTGAEELDRLLLEEGKHRVLDFPTNA
jgi:hypothetical protein